MKITKSQLKQIIKEELESVLNEEPSDHRRDRNRERHGMRMTRPNRKSAESDMPELDREILILKQIYGDQLERLNEPEGSLKKNVESMKQALHSQPNREVRLQALDYILGTLPGWEPGTTPEI